MRVYRRSGSKYWQAAFNYGGRRYQFSTKLRDKKDALDLACAKRTAFVKGEAGIKEKPKPKPVTVAELLAALEAHYRREGRASPQNLSAIRVAARAFGPKMADALTAAHLDSYIERRLREGARNATVNCVTGILGRAYSLAKLEPPEIQHLTEKNNVRKGFFERAEFERVASSLPPDLADFAHFGFLTGWRKSEIASLRWSDLDADAVRLRAEHSKNREARSVPIAGELVALIERRRRARTVETAESSRLAEWVFHRGGEPIREFRKSWASACAKAGVAGRLFHDLRRSAVVGMIRSGVPQTVAMAISGHRTTSMFVRYAIASEGDKAAAFERLGQYHERAQRKVVPMAVQEGRP